MTHSLITVAIPFDRKKVGQVRQYLGAFGNLCDKKAIQPAQRLRQSLDHTDVIHFMSLNVVPPDENSGAHLIVEVSADGAEASVLERLATILDQELPQLRQTAGLTLGKPLYDLLMSYRHRIGPRWSDTLGLPFIGAPGMTVRRIQEECRLSTLVSTKILPDALDPTSALNTLRNVRRMLWDDEAEKWAFIAEPVAWLSWPRSTHGIPVQVILSVLNLLWPIQLVLAVLWVAFVALGYVLAAAAFGGFGTWQAILIAIAIAIGLPIVTAIVALAAAGTLYWLFRRSEKRDTPNDKAPERACVDEVMRGENHAAQNHLFGISTMKGGIVRKLALRLVFATIRRFVAKVFRPGQLNEIGTIHFARWVLLPGTDKLLFLSNYGGSWESYLEDFIEKAHEGLTGVWSNTVDFPKTEKLFQKGATDGDRFKRWARRQQHPTLVWYSAYPAVTTGRIRVNALIRQGIACATTEADAADWLACFGSAPRFPSELDVSDIPTLVFGGLSPLTHGQALILRLECSRAKDWLRQIEPSFSYGDRLPNPQAGALLVAFSARGLKKLRLKDRDLETFPTPFQDGMSVDWRSRALGDLDNNAPSQWKWGKPDEEIDAILLLYAGDQQSLAQCAALRLQELKSFGHAVIRTIEFRPLPGSGKGKLEPYEQQQLQQQAPQKLRERERLIAEPFGFTDGISQPIIRGTRKWISNRDRHHVVKPGEFILGYPDNLNYIPPSPSVLADDDPNNMLPPLGADPFRDRPDFSHPQTTTERDLGRNGSFLVVRQLEQHVAAFDKFLDDQADCLKDDPRAPSDPKDRRDWIGAKMVGRWKDGTSLVRNPHAPGTRRKPFAKPDNDFLFGEDDPSGLKCPFGAHIRRANPRDSLNPGSSEQLRISNRHRILRVGRVYEPQGDLTKPGLFFMCLNADIERQFEFVQQTWTMAPSFHGLESEVDCFVARGSTDVMTIPTLAGPLCLSRLTDFVTVRGGGYFFMPGRRTVRFLAAP